MYVSLAWYFIWAHEVGVVVGNSLLELSVCKLTLFFCKRVTLVWLWLREVGWQLVRLISFIQQVISILLCVRGPLDRNKRP